MFSIFKIESLIIIGYSRLMTYGYFFQLKSAEGHKVKGVIIYSDPEQYSPYGKSYPDTWYLPKDGVQRGTVLRIRGDPLSNGYPALGKNLILCNCIFIMYIHYVYSNVYSNVYSDVYMILCLT